ncbi:MAG: SDR family NAD(P)-dependent oxidoreductase [Planctomycetes bacterium]|nr:SDR family NAD(P)-dependent oxidoreductase [Planctomycetota bacterium]MBI3843325.1 SDR family NAD(P)-dependent oxidoreductase [Planctomycetota bacterium]
MVAPFWKDRVVFLTGASSGIGEALARHVGAEGARLGLFARREDRLTSLVGGIERAGGRAIALPGDVTDRSKIDLAVARLVDAFGPVDIAIANAGIGVPTPAIGFDGAAAAQIVDVNVVGAIHTVAACLPSMLERRSGHLVAIASLAAFRGLPGSAAYCASKAAMRSLFESLRMDLHGSGVRVSTICPGFIDTPMTAKSRFPLPFLMTVDAGARRIARSIERGRREDAFPWPLSATVRLLGHLPAGIYDALGPIVRRTRATRDE